MRRVEKTDNLVLTAMMLCLVTLATYALKVPNPFTQGYVHLGDTFIFISVLVLGKKNGTIASAIGAALADIMGGYAIFAVGTLIAKGLMAFVMGTFIELGAKKASGAVGGNDRSAAGHPSDSVSSKADSIDESISSRVGSSDHATHAKLFVSGDPQASSGSGTAILSYSPYELLAMALGGLTEVAVYVPVNSIVYGNLTFGLLSIPGNLGQFICSMIVAVVLVHALLKTPVKRYLTFAHR